MKKFEITHTLMTIAVVGYLATGVLTFMDSYTHGDKFHSLTRDVFLAVIAFGKMENGIEDKNKKEDKNSNRP